MRLEFKKHWRAALNYSAASGLPSPPAPLVKASIHLKFAVLMALSVPAVSALGQPVTQPYPTRPITFVAPFAAGGSIDLVARVIGKKMSAALGQPVIIENRPGAGGEVGIGGVAKAKADGYTLLTSPSGAITAGPHFRKQPYDVIRDLRPVAMLAAISTVLAVNSSLPVKNLAEFITYAQQRPGKITCGNPGLGSGNHLAAEMLQNMGQFDLIAVPYKGSAAMALAVASGELHAGSDDLTSFLPFTANGKVRILAAYGPTRMLTAPDIPTVAEAGVANYRAQSWAGLFAPAGTPQDIVARLNEQVMRALQSQDVIDAFLKAGLEPVPPITPARFAQLVSDEHSKTGKLIKDANIKAE